MSGKKNISQILDTLKELETYEFENDVERRRVMKAAYKTYRKTQIPSEFHMDAWTEATSMAALQIGLDTSLFEKWQAAGTHQSTEQLSRLSGVDQSLLNPLLRLMAVNHLIDEDGPDKFSQSPITLSLSRPEMSCFVPIYVEALTPLVMHYPKYFAENGYARPTKMEEAPITQSITGGIAWWSYLKQNPVMADNFHRMMQGYASDRESWLSTYPAEKLLEGLEPDGPILVDVGGGRGQDIEKFRAKFPEQSKGRLFLQDQPVVIADAKVHEDVRALEHSFFEEQPIKGARAYYLHCVLHDWPDAEAKQILMALKPALKKGYSKILINDTVIPPEKADSQITTMDLVMMGAFSARERTEAEFEKLIADCELKIVKIWTDERAIESVIEVELP